MKNYSQEEILNYIESQIKESYQDLKKCYIAELGEKKGEKAFQSFTDTAPLCIHNDLFGGEFIMFDNKRNFGSWFFEEKLQSKYLINLKRKQDLTNNLVDKKDKKQTLKSVIKEMKQNEKLAKKTKAEDLMLK